MSIHTSDKREITLQHLAEPGHANFGGKVHGGQVMKWMDLAGYACAAGWSSSYCVTSFVGGMRFLRPIHIGMLVEVHAQVVYTGRTSMHLTLDVYCRYPTDRERKKATHCIMHFVAVDEMGKPTKVPTWTPATEEDKKLEQYAKKLSEYRGNLEKLMEGHYTD